MRDQGTPPPIQSVKYFTSSRNQEFQEYLLSCSHAREKTMEMALEDSPACFSSTTFGLIFVRLGYF